MRTWCTFLLLKWKKKLIYVVYCFISCNLSQANWFLFLATRKCCSKKGFILQFESFIIVCTYNKCGNYSRVETNQGRKLLIIGRFWVRKLFKGGNYSRPETIRGNTVCIFFGYFIFFLLSLLFVCLVLFLLSIADLKNCNNFLFIMLIFS